MTAIRACAAGIWAVLRAPGLAIVITILTIATMLPFALTLGDRLREALGNQPPINLDAEEIDAEWWMAFRDRARGLEATFTPAVIGFAAPLENVSAIADGTRRPVILLLPVALYGLLWAFLWGGLIQRFAEGRRRGVRAFVQSGLRTLPRFVVISLAAAAVATILYLTVHALLFGPIYAWGAAVAGSERNAFFWRVVLYLVFGSLLALLSVIADYTRVAIGLTTSASVRESGRAAIAFVRAHSGSVAAVFLLNGVLLVLLLVLYGLVDRRFSGWRGVILGQAYIVARLGIRLTSIASEVRLFRGLSSDAAHGVSIDPEKPGPPAAT